MDKLPGFRKEGKIKDSRICVPAIIASDRESCESIAMRCWVEEGVGE